jgi:hypothetical protein
VIEAGTLTVGVAERNSKTLSGSMTMTRRVISVRTMPKRIARLQAGRSTANASDLPQGKAEGGTSAAPGSCPAGSAGIPSTVAEAEKIDLEFFR